MNGLTRAWRLCNIPTTRGPRSYSARAVKPARDASQLLDSSDQQILTIVQRRVAERKQLLSNSTSHADEIPRARRLKELEPVHSAWEEWQRTAESLRETATLLEDEDASIRALAAEEHDALSSAMSHQVKVVLPSLLLPASRTAAFSTLIELKSGVGGSESSLFLSELLRLYTRFANLHGWSAKILTKDDRDGGGIKNASLEVMGEGSYDALRWESGVHRVQRVPATETSGRVHTSTVVVMALPLPPESSGSEDALYEDKDVTVEVMRARGAGGQHVNKTESAVRLTHVPSGITVSMQDERSQHQNRARAYQVLRARLLDRKIHSEMVERRERRRELVRSADRSEKVRTYNYVQDRITDHRVGLTIMNLGRVMEGEGLQDFVDALSKDHEQSLLDSLLEESTDSSH